MVCLSKFAAVLLLPSPCADASFVVPDIIQDVNITFLKRLVVPDIIQDVNITFLKRHGPVAMVGEPKTFLPSEEDIEAMTPQQKKKRLHFWLSLSLCSYAGLVVLGTGILVVGPRLRSASSYLLVGSDEREVKALSYKSQQTIVAAAFAVNFCVDWACVFGSVRIGALSKTCGLDWEMYYTVFALNGTWCLIQAVYAVRRLPDKRSFSPASFGLATLSGLMPFLSDTFDTLKDIVFGGLCVISNNSILRVVGWVSWASTFGTTVYLILQPDSLQDISTSYLAVMLADTQDDGVILVDTQDASQIENSIAAMTQVETQPDSKIVQFLWGKLLPMVYKQTTPGKQKILLVESAPQAVAALLYVALEGGSKWVAIFNIALPLAQAAFAKCLYRPLERNLAPWSGAQLHAAISDGIVAKEEHLRRSISPQNIPQEHLRNPEEMLRYWDWSSPAAEDMLRFFGLVAPHCKCFTEIFGFELKEIHRLGKERRLGKNRGDCGFDPWKETRWLRVIWAECNFITSLEEVSLVGAGDLFNGEMPVSFAGLETNLRTRRVFLDANEISNVDKLCRALEKNTTLEGLSLKDNKISKIDDVGRALEKNTMLKFLSLGNNHISSIDALGPALEKNTTLTLLDLSGNQIQSIDAIGAALEKNTTLKKLELANNEIDSFDALSKVAKAKIYGMETQKPEGKP